MAVVRAILYQLQRLDAFLLDALYQNVQRMQDRVHAARPLATGSAVGLTSRALGQGANSQVELPSWTADGFRRMDLNDTEVFALQVAPWTFITSPYSYSLIAMVVILNRIQHVVSPSHDPDSLRLGPWISKFLPINASSTQTRFLIRSVSLYMLCKTTLRMGIIVLQAFEMYPSARPFAPLGQWAAMASMVDVCWSAFVAVCLAMVVSTFTRALDGSGTPTSSFNLPQFAFLLHLYSSPLGSMFNPVVNPQQGSTPAPRPNRHVLMTIMLPLLQITMLHAQGTWKRYSRNVLIPTSICGILGLCHFVYVLLKGQLMDYPILQVVPSSLELFLVLMVVCTTCLNILSQILGQGAITRPLFAPGASSLPTLDEEYAVALVRLGTSSVDATAVAGLGNEVAPVSAAMQEGLVRLGPSEVSNLHLPNKSKRGEHSKRKRVQNPFATEIKHVRALTTEGEMWINFTWIKEMERLGRSLWRASKGIWRTMRGKNFPGPGPAEPTSETLRTPSDLDLQVVPQRFLNGEAISDEDSDFEDDASPPNDESEAESDSSEQMVLGTKDDSDTDEVEGEMETSQLYAEHGSQRESSPLAPVLLAHLTSSTGSPLTRRRYSSLLNYQDDSLVQRNGWYDLQNVPQRSLSTVQSRIPGFSGIQDKPEDTVRLCVICMGSERVIICWPCRCLSMCDDCRSNLASRNGPSKHSCPCCRQSVEGFSRIFIP
ncbi:hypothetical protein CPB86DRAFT_721686 [Serendipita vermifera]|nr:hypothetical protein CPB86DRAFT_721686 [Serendipita vermifera]